ncbi:aminopeptidase N-like isoform X3 [Homalodisca vitripennis]|uniref:aminopeptidase N-like isoform X3 n=1 Tax=Homalodisca vitripennis TaxID=197043 RepID=UPI001EEBCD82|nr:aminopeptidase N-like isoform X3 [Homalodisca vitripennis]
MTEVMSNGVCCVILAMMATSSALAVYRLPVNIVPTHYDLDIITFLEPDNFSFQGNVKIKVKCSQATDIIKVHARDLDFDKEKISVTADTGNSLNIADSYSDVDNEFYVVKTKEPLKGGELYSLNLSFHGLLKENLIGYYRSYYTDPETNTTKWLTVTHFEPSDARQAFPCFDEPAMKATFTIRLAHKDNYKSVSNMPLKNTTPFENKPGWVWDEFETTVPMSTYLVAYMVSDFEFQQSETTSNNVLFRVWTHRDVLHQTEFASRVGPRFLSFYEDFFDVKYPLPKQDLLAIPDFKIGAMENWGIITFREVALLMDEKETSSRAKLRIANVIAHELAHMWFGNLVTMQWWTDLWLKEGFATYMAGLSVHHEFPEWNSLDESALSDLLNVFNLDSLKSSHPVSVPIGHPNEIMQIFDAISYDKGSFLLRMMSLFLGENVFKRGVSEYLKKHKYGNAEQDDLWVSLTEQAHKHNALPPELSVKQIMDTWTLQTGYPLITVTRDYQNRKATVSQERYLAIKSTNPEDYKGCWWVPLSYSTSKEPDFNRTQPQQWLSCDKTSAELDVGVGKGEWFILNNRAAGLYRVNYDQENWEMLAALLNSPQHTQVDALNRAQLIIDVMDVAELGRLSYQLAFEIIGSLRHEKEFLPWEAGLAKLEPIKTMLSRTANYGSFKKFIQKLMAPIVSSLGTLTEEPSTFEQSRLLSCIATWACPLEVGDFASQASQLYKQWRSSPNPDTDNPIPKDVRSAVYSHIVREGKVEEWDFLWERYKNTNLSTEKTNIMIALTTTKEVWLLNRCLDWTLDSNSGIRKQESFIMFALVAKQETGFYVAQKFFFRNIKRISDYFGATSALIGRYITAIAQQMIHPKELEELKWFVDSNEELLAPASLAVTQALESVQINIDWMKNHYSAISTVLSEVTGS